MVDDRLLEYMCKRLLGVYLKYRWEAYYWIYMTQFTCALWRRSSLVITYTGESCFFLSRGGWSVFG